MAKARKKLSNDGKSMTFTDNLHRPSASRTTPGDSGMICLYRHGSDNLDSDQFVHDNITSFR